MHRHTHWLRESQLFDNVLVNIFESIYISFFLFHPSPILYSSVTSPFHETDTWKIYDRQFCFFSNALLYFRFITFRACTLYCYEWESRVSLLLLLSSLWVKKKKINVYMSIDIAIRLTILRSIYDIKKKDHQYPYVARNGRCPNRYYLSTNHRTG